MSHHTATHAKPHVHTGLIAMLKKAATRYAALHKRYRVTGGAFIFAVEFAALIATHEFLIHFGILATVTTWDTLVTLAES